MGFQAKFLAIKTFAGKGGRWGKQLCFGVVGSYDRFIADALPILRSRQP